MRDFTNERVIVSVLIPHVICDKEGNGLLYVRPAANSPLSPDEVDAMVGQAGTRWNAVPDAFAKLEASLVRDSAIGGKWKYPNGPLALEAMEILRNALQGD